MGQATTIVDKVVRNPGLALAVYEQLQARLGELKVVGGWTLGRLPASDRRELRREDAAGHTTAVVWLDDTGFFRWSLRDISRQAIAAASLPAALDAADEALTEQGYLLTGETPPIALPWANRGRADGNGRIVVFIEPDRVNDRFLIKFDESIGMNDASEGGLIGAKEVADSVLEALGWVLL